MEAEKTRQVFLTVAMFAHGYATIIASNGLAYDEELIAEHLNTRGTARSLRPDRRIRNDEETV